MTPPAAPSSPPDMPPSPDTVPPVGAHDERDWPRCHNGLCGVSPFVARREGVSRVVCEAAVRFAWLMDPDISSAKRLVRAALLCTPAPRNVQGSTRAPRRALRSAHIGRCLTLELLSHECRELPDRVEPCPSVLITQRSQVQILPPLPGSAGQRPDRQDGGRAFCLFVGGSLVDWTRSAARCGEDWHGSASRWAAGGIAARHPRHRAELSAQACSAAGALVAGIHQDGRSDSARCRRLAEAAAELHAGVAWKALRVDDYDAAGRRL